jgi:threonine-phosphate decarboxylase
MRLPLWRGNSAKDRAYQQATWRWLAQEGALLSGPPPASRPDRVSWAGELSFYVATSGLDLQQALLQQHILIRSCANYPGLENGYYRVAIRSPEENQQLLTALSAILTAAV